MNTYDKLWPRFLIMAIAISLMSVMETVQAAAPAKPVKRHLAAKPIPATRLSQHVISGKAGLGGSPLDLSPEEMQDFSDAAKKANNSLDFADQGDAAVRESNWTRAQTCYQQALDLWPANKSALYGLGKCADVAGDTASAVRYYRKAIYSDPRNPHHYGIVPGDGYGTNDVARLMEFALLLNKARQQQEALAVYNRAAHLLNYRDADTNGGKPYLKVLLPEFGTDPNAAVYTAQRMQAMAHVAISIEEGAFGSDDALLQAQEAVRLYPDSPITYFYLGKQLQLSRKPEAKAAFERAGSLGDDQIGAAVQGELKIYH